VTVYIDIILLENIGMNYILLMATAILIKKETKILRTLLASMVGAVFAIISYAQILPMYSSLLAKILVSIVMVYIALKPQTAKTLLKHIILFYFVSFVFGGCAFALLYIIRPEQILMKNGVYIGTYPIKIAILAGVIGIPLLQIVARLLKHKLSHQRIYEITIHLNQKTKTVNALLDTGNLLKEPITGVPVMVVEKRALEDFIPNSILEHIEEIIGGDVQSIENENMEYISKLKIIPFTSLGKNNGMLLGMKAEKITVHIEDTEEEIPNIIIGIYDQIFSKNHQYAALIGLEALERRKENECIASAER